MALERLGGWQPWFCGFQQNALSDFGSLMREKKHVSHRLISAKQNIDP